MPYMLLISVTLMALASSSCVQSQPPAVQETAAVTLVNYRPLDFAPMRVESGPDAEQGFDLIAPGDLERTPRDYVKATATVKSADTARVTLAMVDILDREYRGETLVLEANVEGSVSVDAEQVGRPVSMLRTVRLFVQGQPVEVLDLSITCAVEKLPEPDVVVRGPLDNTSIQAALDSLGEAGGVVYIPAGTYQINDQIVVPSDNLTIYGDGPETILKATWYQARGLLVMDGRSNVRITRLRFQGRPETAFRGYTEQAHAATPEDVGRRDNVMTRAVDIVNSNNVRFDHCTVELFGHTGLIIRGEGLVVVDHCFFQKNFRYGYGYGVVPHATKECYIEDSNFENHRHGVAGSSNSMATYICRFSRFVKDVQAVPAEGWRQVTSHEIDVHHGCDWLYAHDNYVEMKNAMMSSAVALRGNSAWVYRHLIVNSNIGVRVVGYSDDVWTWGNEFRNVSEPHSSSATGKVYFDEQPANFAEIPYPHALNRPGWWPGAGDRTATLVRPDAQFHGPEDAVVLQAIADDTQ